MVISVAPLLRRQNQSRSYGHGWIMGENGRRWHPANSQSELLAGLTGNRSKKKWLSKLSSILSR